MKRDDATHTPAAKGTDAGGAAGAGASDAAGAGAASTGASGGGALEAHRPRPRRTLNLFDRLVRVPIGFLWLGVLAVVAVPVIIYMTLLYYAARWTSSLFGRGRASRAGRADREERVA